MNNREVIDGVVRITTIQEPIVKEFTLSQAVEQLNGIISSRTEINSQITELQARDAQLATLQEYRQGIVGSMTE